MTIQDTKARDARRAVKRWVQIDPTRVQVAAFILVGTIALLFAGIQPILLGALVEEHRLTSAALGEAATIEFFAVGVGVGVAGATFSPTHLRLKGALAAIILILANFLALRESGVAILIDRGVAGLGEGLIVWLTASLISRATTPARWAGIFLVTQGLAQFGLAILLPVTVMKYMGADGGFMVLAITGVIALFAMAALPGSLPTLKHHDEQRASGYSSSSLWSLLSVFLIFAFFIGLFAYFGQFATQAHLTQEQSGLAVALAVGLSIVGSGAAAGLASKVSYIATAILCLPINLGVLVIFAGRPSSAIFIATSAVFGFFWGFFMPFQVALVIEVDPTRRASLLVPGIQGIGAAAGPLLCSFFVTDTEVRGALPVLASCLLISFCVGAALHLVRRRHLPTANAAPL